MLRIGAATALWASAVWLWPSEVAELGLDRLTSGQAGLIAASCTAFVVGSRLALDRILDCRSFRLAVGIGRHRPSLPMPIRLVLHSAAAGSDDTDRTRTDAQAPAPDGPCIGSSSRPRTSPVPRVGQTADM